MKTNTQQLTFDTLPAAEYYRAVIRDMQQATSSITIVVYLFIWGDTMERFFTALEEAAARGVRVKIVFDKMSLYYVSRGRVPGNPFRHPDDRRYGKTMASLDRMRAAGADITEIGPIGLNPYRGRCHTKFTVVDNTVYCFGGVNLYDNAFTNVDYMLRTVNTDLADRLRQLAQVIAEDRPVDDVIEPLDAHNTLLIDGGRPGHSAIYDRACELAGQAAKVYYVSQFFPTGQLTGLLRQAGATCYMTRPRHSPVHIGAMLTADRLRTRLRNHYRGQTFLHAKFILFELKDGSRALVAGSHNFSWQGVTYGTKEIAICSTDPQLWQQLHDYMQTEVIGS